LTNDKICYIVGAGENYGLDFVPRPRDFVIGADGGFAHLKQSHIAADLVIGDFDSLDCMPDHPVVVALDKKKDETDAFAAVREGIKRGYREFWFYCCTGGRIDHTIANMQLLAHLSQNGLKGRLVAKDQIIAAVTDGGISFAPYSGGYISVFSHSGTSVGVYLKGLKYELEDAELTNTFPIGVSNEFVGGESAVSVGSGTLIVVFPKEAKDKMH